MKFPSKSIQPTQRVEKLLSFFQLFVDELNVAQSQKQINTLIKELGSIQKEDIRLLESRENTHAFLVEIIGLIRDKLYTLFSGGSVCGVEIFYILLFVADSAQGYVEVDSRFEAFAKLAQKSLFSPENSDVENILYIELYILSKALMNMSDMKAIIEEYIMLIILVDINLPLSLEHTQFIVKSFENLDIDMPTLLNAMSKQQELQTYFAYPSLTRRSILNWQIHCFWNVACFFNHPEWLRLYPLWRDIFYTLLEKGETDSLDEAMYLQFFIYHMCGNNFQNQDQWRNFCEEIDRVAVKHYESFARTQGIYGAKPTDKTKKKTIAFLRDRLVANSPYKVEYSLLSNLLSDESFRREYDVKIYTMNLFEKSIDDEQVIKSYREIGVEVINVVSHLNAKGFYNSHLQKALCIKSALNADNVSILISPNNGYGISDFIFASRSVPLQIYYSHGNFVYDLPCIDLKITHICQNKTHITHEGYEFYGVPVKMQDKFYNPPLSPKDKECIKAKLAEFPPNSIILGSIGRLVKLYSRPYWECVINIMLAYPQSIYLACGVGNSALVVECIMSIFTSQEEAQRFLERVHFVGYVDSVIYGHLIDIWLDSFPFEQGESRIEYVAKGGLSLVMSKEDEQMRLKNLTELIEQWKLLRYGENTPKSQEEALLALNLLHDKHLPFVAFSPQEYIAKGKKLLEYYASGDTETIQTFREIIANGRKIGDEIKQYQGIRAFKVILKTPVSNSKSK